MTEKSNSAPAKVLVKQLKALLDGGHAHATLEDAARDFPEELRGVVPDHLPYSGWQILEHLRIAQRDILDFCDNADGSYKEKKWPDDYWPKAPDPPNSKSWQESLHHIKSDRKAFDALLDNANEDELARAFPWGEGQNLFQEALQIADHNAYHIGELIVIRRLLDAWEK